MFTHELVHLRDKSFRGFRIVWNLLCGIPFLMPSFMYYTHVDHHLRKHFGTDHDGEYLPLGTRSPWHLLAYMCQPLVLPVLAVARFLVGTPISWIVPGFRDFLHRHASSMVIDPSYMRPLPTRQVLRIMRLQEVPLLPVDGQRGGVADRCETSALRLPAHGLPGERVILYLNPFRTLGAHRYSARRPRS